MTIHPEHVLAVAVMAFITHVVVDHYRRLK